MSAGRIAPQESTTTSPSGRRLMLVVGTNGQPAPSRAPLHYAVNDAIDMAHVLQQASCGFKLVRPPLLGEQATTSQVRDAVLELADQLQEDDTGLFFFSGHAEAIAREAKRDDVYLVTHDFDVKRIKRDEHAHLSLSWLRQVLFEHEKAQSVLIILDCCYAGKFRDSAPDPYLDELKDRLCYYFEGPGAQSPSSPGGIRLALTATGASVAKEQDGHGVLTAHLLAALKGECERIADEQGRITFGRLFDHLAQTLPAEQPDRRPWRFGADAGLILATYPHLSAQKRRERGQATRRAEARQRLRALISNHHDGFLQDRLDSFVGREKELAEIRSKIEELLPTGGYLTISGQAGQGKSSIIARLVEDRAQQQGGRERVAYHFIPFNPAPDYQIALLKNLMARLALKYDLSDLFLASESRSALSEAFPEVLKAIAGQSKQEVIFVDGLDQLQPDQQTGLRDLSFLPQGPGNPPPGIVFVLGTRPNDTLRPLTLLTPHRPYQLPGMSREDFDAILRHRNVALARDLADRFYETLEHNALYLDLVAKELAARPHIDHQEVEKIIQQLANDPANLFTLSLERLRWQKELWVAVIKPVLGLLLTASEALSRVHLKQLLNLESASPVDADQLHRGLACLGGLVVVNEQQQYNLFHLKFRDYLHQGAQYSQAEPLFDADDEQRWHRRFVAWCEQGGLERIWQESAEPVEQGRRRYARQHYITHLYHAGEGEWNRLFQILDEGAYGRAKVWDDPSMHTYALDLDLGRQAAAWAGWSQSQAIAHLPHLWRYTLLRCSLASRADHYPREAFETMLLLGEEAKALGLAELLTVPKYKAEIFTLIAAHLVKQPGREREALQLFSRTERLIASLSDDEDKASALSTLAGSLALAGQEQEARRLWQQAGRLIASLSDDWLKARALSTLAGSLALAGQEQEARRLWQQAERLIASLSDDWHKASALSALTESLTLAGQWQEAERLIASLPDDEDKASALSTLAGALALAGQEQEARRLWQEAERLIASLPDDTYKAWILSALARMLVQAGQEQEARRLWQEAERLIASLPDDRDKAPALSERAEALAQSGLWQEAERVTASLPDDTYKASALSALARALALAGQEQEARRLWQEAERFIASLLDVIGKASALSTLAGALALAGQWQEAERLIASLPDDEDKASALSTLAGSLALAGQEQEARRLWQETERLIASLPDDWLKARALSTLAGSLALAGQKQKARRLWQEAECLIASLPDDRRKDWTLSALVGALALAGHWQEAERLTASFPDDWHKAWALVLAGYWQEAERLIASLSDIIGESWVLSALAGALAQAEQWQEAEHLTASIPDDRRKASALSALAGALARHNEYGRLVSLVQHWWLRTTCRDDAIQILPLAFDLIPRSPELGMAFYSAFRWVDEFLRGEQ